MAASHGRAAGATPLQHKTKQARLATHEWRPPRPTAAAAHWPSSASRTKVRQNVPTPTQSARATARPPERTASTPGTRSQNGHQQRQPEHRLSVDCAGTGPTPARHPPTRPRSARPPWRLPPSVAADHRAAHTQRTISGVSSSCSSPMRMISTSHEESTPMTMVVTPCATEWGVAGTQASSASAMENGGHELETSPPLRVDWLRQKKKATKSNQDAARALHADLRGAAPGTPNVPEKRFHK